MLINTTFSKVCAQTCSYVNYQMCPCIAARSLYQPVLLAAVQHTGLCLRDLSSSTQSVFPRSPLPCKLSLSLSLSLCLSPPPVFSCRSACSSHSPNGNRQTRQHGSDNITTRLTIFVRVPAESVKGFIFLQEVLGSEGKGLSCNLYGGV